MGYEIQLRCDNCEEVTPSFKMFRVATPNLGRWIYEHAHCANQYVSSTTNIQEIPVTFTRIIESETIGDGMQDWKFPLTDTHCGWLENIDEMENTP